MTVAVEKLQKWLGAKEDEHLECKEAKTNFHVETLVEYGVALANEGGGKMILGVTDKLPRTVVGSQVFAHLERTKAGLIERLRLRVDVEEIQHPDGRVLVLQVPSRPIGMPLQYEGAYWMRGGRNRARRSKMQIPRKDGHHGARRDREGTSDGQPAHRAL